MVHLLSAREPSALVPAGQQDSEPRGGDECERKESLLTDLPRRAFLSASSLIFSCRDTGDDAQMIWVLQMRTVVKKVLL